MECVCGFSCGTADAFLRHVEAERIRMGDTMDEEKVGMSTHELVESGGLPILPPPRKGSVAANMAKRRDRARSLEIPFTCDACGFSCGTMAAWMRHQGRMHGAPLCTPCEEKSSAMQHTSPEQLTLKKYRNEDKTQGSDTTRAAENIPLIIGPVAARCDSKLSFLSPALSLLHHLRLNERDLLLLLFMKRNSIYIFFHLRMNSSAAPATTTTHDSLTLRMFRSLIRLPLLCVHVFLCAARAIRTRARRRG